MTASTEPAEPAEPGAAGFALGPVHALGEADVDDAVRLSTSAHWNQNASDWRLMLRLGRAWGVRAALADGSRPLVASTLALPYEPAAGVPGRRFAWISMVLVAGEYRRRGLATALLRRAMADLTAAKLVPVLDATPDGRAVYRREGFRDAWGFARYRRPAQPPPPAVALADGGVRLRPLREDDWRAVAALDAPAFGADRLPLLRALAQRLPRSAWVAQDGADAPLQGFVLARDGREASQIGPLVAAGDAPALALLHAALMGLCESRESRGPSSAVYVDLCDRHRGLLPDVQALGFEVQRPFTRMVHDPGNPDGDPHVRAPGDPATVVLVAGPELG